MHTSKFCVFSFCREPTRWNCKLFCLLKLLMQTKTNRRIQLQTVVAKMHYYLSFLVFRLVQITQFIIYQINGRVNDHVIN